MQGITRHKAKLTGDELDNVSPQFISSEQTASMHSFQGGGVPADPTHRLHSCSHGYFVLWPMI